MLTAGRILHFDLRESRSISPLFISLHLPGLPASVLSGVISGATAVGSEAQPSASRIVVVRVPSDAGVSNRYLGWPRVRSRPICWRAGCYFPNLNRLTA